MNNLKEKISALKSRSGTHSPSINTILNEIPEIKVETDACFLSNPYATELFMRYVEEDLIKTGKLKNVLEYYPPQNRDISEHVSKAIGIPAANIFISNGAIESIQAAIHTFTRSKIAIIIPTFSSYYEYALEHHEVVYYQLDKENNFNLDIDKFLSFLKDEKPDTVIIINPNNPNGGYISIDQLSYLLDSLQDVSTVIVDESFVHFAYEDVELSKISSEDLIAKYSNLIIIKSMSKDFGIAGIRAGYAVMSSERVQKLLKTGYLWNVSGLADYFFEVYSSNEFIQEYNIVRKKYIMNTMMFLSNLNEIGSDLKVYPSKANFALIELLNGHNSFDFTLNLLVNNNVYVRDCSDKIGLNGEFIRVASRTFEENLKIVDAIKSNI